MARDKFTLTAAQGSSERLALVKLDEIIAKLDILAIKLDADGGVTDQDYAAQLVDLKTVVSQISGSLLGKRD